MLKLLRELLCIHIYEYEHQAGDVEHIECRKCGVHKAH